MHCSNLYHHEPAGTLADRWPNSPASMRVFFCNSGTEANEAAIKLARKHACRKGETERTTILACHGSFHGRTFGALAATDNPRYHEGFEPLPGGFAFTPFNDVDALERRSTNAPPRSSSSRCRAKAASSRATREFLAAARHFCDERGALLDLR